MTDIREFATRDALMQAAAERLADALTQAISDRGEAVAALSGGSTPEPAYMRLASMPLDWPRVTFLLVDERFVPTGHEASNEAMLRRALAPALSAGARLLPMFAENATLEDASHRADAIYAQRSIDIAVMGMGADGHTASWFPQSAQLEAALALDNSRTVIGVTADGAAGSSQRLTLTRAALARAKAVLLLITGAEKRALVQDERRAPLPVDTLFDLPARVETFWAP
jgi:6-phosphogluconolactonase